MPHHKQFKKTLRQEPKRNLRNKIAKTRLRNLIKSVRTAESKDIALEALRNTIPVIDSTARKGIIKKETAARQKSRLHKFVNTLT